MVGPVGVFVDVEVEVRVGVLEGPPGVLVGVLVPPVTTGLVGVLVRVTVLVTADVGVALPQAGREKVGFWPVDNPLALHSNWVMREPVSFCTPTVALDPLWVTVP